MTMIFSGVPKDSFCHPDSKVPAVMTPGTWVPGILIP